MTTLIITTSATMSVLRALVMPEAAFLSSSAQQADFGGDLHRVLISWLLEAPVVFLQILTVLISLPLL